MLGKTPDSILAIKPLKDGVIADLDVTKEMLNYFITKIYGHAIFKPEVMICVPLEVTSVERKALFDSVIGAKKIYIIEEGRAAIIGSGIDISRPSGHMVVDIGGGSTDIAILSLNEVIASRSIRIAGNTFDNDIVRFIKNKYSLQIGERAAENIKKNLATALPKENPKKMPVKGLNIDLGTPESLEISENEIYEAMKNSLYAIVNTAKEVLEKCPPELAADLLENGIVMTGGGALIKGFADLIASEVRVKVFVSKAPLDAVVLGGGYAFDNQKLIKTLQVKEN